MVLFGSQEGAKTSLANALLGLTSESRCTSVAADYGGIAVTRTVVDHTMAGTDIVVVDTPGLVEFVSQKEGTSAYKNGEFERIILGQYKSPWEMTDIDLGLHNEWSVKAALVLFVVPYGNLQQSVKDFQFYSDIAHKHGESSFSSSSSSFIAVNFNELIFCRL